MKDSTVNYKDEIEAALTDKQRDDLDRLKERLEAATGVEEFAPKNNISIFVNCRGHDYDVIKQLHDDLGEKFFKGFEEGNKFKEYTKQFFCWLFGVEYTPKLGINSVNDTGHTPLHIVAGNLQLQKLLIEELGADVNARSANKNDTPIFYAVVTPFIEAVDHLVQSGARVDVVNNKGQNLLHVLSMDHHPSANRDLIETAKYLIEKGVSPLQADKTGKTPIDLLEEKVNEKGGEQYQELLDLFKEKTKFQSMVAQDSISDGLTR